VRRLITVLVTAIIVWLIVTALQDATVPERD